MQNSRAIPTTFRRCTSAAALTVFAATALATCAFAQVVGVENFHQVNEHLYRGAQPSASGFEGLSKLGIKTVIDLRETDSRSAQEKRTVEALGMRYVNIPLQGMSAPSDANVQKVLALFNDSSVGPVFIHCRRGADRTGTMVAVYRIGHDGWENAKALSEAKTDGMSRIEIAMQHYVMRYQPATTTGAATTVVAQQ